MKDLRNEMKELFQSIDRTTLQFYQQHTQEGYSNLNDTLMMIMQMMTDLSEYNKDSNILENDIKKMNEILNSALKALEGKDTILFSDILQYELKEILNNIKMSL